MNRKTLFTIIVVLLVCIVLTVAGTAFLLLQSTPILRTITGGPTAPLSPTLAGQIALPQGTPLASVSMSTEDALKRTNIPERNLYQIVPRLRKDLLLLTPVPTPAPKARSLGDHETFYVVENASTGKYRTITATLQAIVPHGYYWVEDGIQFDKAQLVKSADYFEKSIYPTNHQYFGNEKSPGPDGDVHIHILNTRFQDAAGYFSSEDTFPASIVPYSNQRNIIYLNMDALKPGTDEYSADTAHEFQHLIHSYESLHKTGWIDEGMGDLAIKVNGFDVGGVLRLFGRNPDTQLNTWANEPQASLAHYAASYLFFDYTAGRFGPDFTRDIIHAPAEGINGIQAVLDQRTKTQFADLFADWAVANYLNDPTIENGRYAYTNEKTFRITNEPILSQFPMNRTTHMNEYGTSYFGIQPTTGDVTIYFTGTTTTKLLPVDAHGGHWMWYSNRADLADMTLTREVDLSKVGKATLQFWTWYDIERNFDYAYVEASTDAGKTWSILPGKYSTTENPNGASYGTAYSGRSGASDDKSPAQWVQDQFDLTPYAGKRVLLRLEYITDDAFNAPGWAIDDITIPEIGLNDQVEGGDNGWAADGFVRTDNVLPQRFIVQVVQQGKATTISRLQLDNQNQGNLTITGFGKDVTRAELIVTAQAPTTTEPAEYQFGIVPR